MLFNKAYFKWIVTGVFSLFLFLVLPWMSTLSETITGTAASIDTNFSFKVLTYYEIRESFGEIGRRFYIIQRVTFDVIWPIVYTLFLIMLNTMIDKWKDIHIKLVLFAVVFDFLENIIAVIFMIQYPSEYETIVYMLMMSSMMKWILITAAFILPIVSYVYKKIATTK